MCLCMCAYVCVRVHEYGLCVYCVHVCVLVNMLACMCGYVCTCVCLYVRVRLSASARISVCWCVGVYAHGIACVHDVCLHTHTYVFVFACLWLKVCSIML